MFLNQTWVPRFRLALRNVQAMVLDNISRLGEGWNQHFRFGKQDIWIYHHDGPFLEGIFFGLGKDEAATERLISKELLAHLGVCRARRDRSRRQR